MRSHFVACLVVWFWVGPGRTEEWPDFRGPTGQGISSATKIPATWSDTENVAWKTPIPGSGWSSPILFQGRVYLTTAIEQPNRDQSLAALAVDLKTGKILWQKEVFRQDARTAPRIHRKASHANPTPITDGDKLFVHFGHQGTACLDFEGNIVWRNNRIRYAPVHGNGGTPVLVNDLLVFSCDGSDKQFVVALAKDTGQIEWQTNRETSALKKFAFCTPLVITVDGRKQIVSPGAGLVAAYDPRSGKEIWRVRYGNGYSVVPRPVFGHGLVYVCTGFDTAKLLAIRPTGKGDVTDSHVAWSYDTGIPRTSSLLLFENELYMVSDFGVAQCLDAKSGRLLWRERLGGGFSASPLYADGKIFFPAENGVCTVIRPGKKFVRLARNTLPERTFASFAVMDGALIIRTEKHLYRIQSSDK
ncbi:MAG: serine/threonine protein kinase [Gemmatales bacterium]|nr:MAG: serine/threonine protein kinase [Gemmatales bacterium]